MSPSSSLLEALAHDELASVGAALEAPDARALTLTCTIAQALAPVIKRGHRTRVECFLCGGLLFQPHELADCGHTACARCIKKRVYDAEQAWRPWHCPAAACGVLVRRRPLRLARERERELERSLCFVCASWPDDSFDFFLPWARFPGDYDFLPAVHPDDLPHALSEWPHCRLWVLHHHSAPCFESRVVSCNDEGGGAVRTADVLAQLCTLLEGPAIREHDVRRPCILLRARPLAPRALTRALASPAVGRRCSCRPRMRWTLGIYRKARGNPFTTCPGSVSSRLGREPPANSRQNALAWSADRIACMIHESNRQSNAFFGFFAMSTQTRKPHASHRVIC
jgi:hypothetical protein